MFLGFRVRTHVGEAKKERMRTDKKLMQTQTQSQWLRRTY